MNKKRNRKDHEFDRNVCGFCGEPPDEKKCGKFFTSKYGFSVHQYCMFFSAALPQNGKDDEGFEGFLEKDVLKEIRRAARLTCCMCGKKGASAGCCNLHCRKGFHFFCGADHKYLFQFFGQFRAYCVDHRLHQKTRSFPTKKSQCPICLESVQCRVSPDILTTPCCKDVWFHRSCVQEQATVSGYFFRCSVCNDKNKFVGEMKRMGIYVPDRDAAWEDGDNFSELLEKYSHCDYISCICPLGRKHSTDSGKWEIVLCASCGQFGTHFGCKSWNTNPPYLLCPTCRPVHEDSIPTTDAAASSLTLNPGEPVAKSSNSRKGGKRPRKTRPHVDSDTDSDDITNVLNGLKRQTQDDFLNSDTNFFVQRAIAAGTAAISTGGSKKFQTSQSSPPMPSNRKRKAQDGESDDEILITKYVPAQKCEICPKCNRRKPTSTASRPPAKLPRKIFPTGGASSTLRSTCTITKADVERKEHGYESEAFEREAGKLNTQPGNRNEEVRNVRVADYEVLELAAENTDKSSVLLLSSEITTSGENGKVVTKVSFGKNCKNRQQGDAVNSSSWRGSVESLHTNSNVETNEKSRKDSTELREYSNFVIEINEEVSNGTDGSFVEKQRQKRHENVDIIFVDQHVSGRQSESFENTSETTEERISGSEETSKNISERSISDEKSSDATGKRSSSPRIEVETNTELFGSFVTTSQSNSSQMLNCNSNTSTFSALLPTSSDESYVREAVRSARKTIFSF